MSNPNASHAEKTGLRIQVIVGSTREGRNADAVLRWITPVIEAHGSFEVEMLDLRQWPLPLFQETIATVGDFKNPTYSQPVVKQWNSKIAAADGYIIVTPEYNHSVPAVLKNALDSVFFSFGFRHKPVCFVSYSLGVTAGVRAVEHLNQIMLAAEAVPTSTPTLVPLVTKAFGPEGKPVNPALDVGLTVMLDDLAWTAKALKEARSRGVLTPAAIRIRTAAGR